MLSRGNVSMITLPTGNVVFKRISDFNGLYMNKNGIVKRSLVLADSDITDSFVYNTVKILPKIMLRIKANEKISEIKMF